MVVEEPESQALKEYLVANPRKLATSEIALVEVHRATAVAHPGGERRERAERLLESCLLIELGRPLLRAAAAIASVELRTLDAIHAASAELAEPDEVIVYDRRLRRAAEEAGLPVVAPGV